MSLSSSTPLLFSHPSTTAMARLRKRSAFISKFISFMKSKGSTGETLDLDKGRAEEASALQVKEYRDGECGFIVFNIDV